MEICQIVSQLELEEVNRAHNVPRFDDKSSTSCSSNLTLQSPSILNDDDEYDFTLLTNTCGESGAKPTDPAILSSWHHWRACARSTVDAATMTVRCSLVPSRYVLTL
ncbi:hypothetical protein J6590_102935 [Homalodisca vitripennis]|nr:hypothetical protein J6590_102935 [Homalodisca vitripennis]